MMKQWVVKDYMKMPYDIKEESKEIEYLKMDHHFIDYEVLEAVDNVKEWNTLNV